MQNVSGKIQMFSTKYPLIFSLLSFILFGIASCSSPTESSKGNLAGVVQLEGQSDNSGIVIAIYELANLDTTIVRINQTYPHIGVIINQHTEFDHRLQSPVKFTETLTDGSFEIEKIPTGKYNLVAIKDGWGFKYLFDLVIVEDENEMIVQPVLYLETIYSGYFEDQNNYFLSDHHYIIEDDSELLPNQYLEIQSGAIIRINPGKDLTIHGTIKAQGEESNMFWVTSNDGFGEELTKSDSLQYYNQMELSSFAFVEDDLMEFGKWDWGNTCLLSKVDNANMQNSIFQNGICGYYVTNVDIANCSNILAINFNGGNEGGVYFNLGNQGNIKQNIILNCYNGIKLKNYSSTNVKNNFLKNGIIGISVSYYSSSIIQNNELLDLYIGLSVEQSSNPIIQFNIIKSYRCLTTYKLYDYMLEANYNNLEFIEYSILSGFRSYLNINCVNNYFYTIDADDIANSIFDQDNAEPTLQQYYGIVIYQPFLLEEYLNAGIGGS
jgi:hypothetical protein